MVAPAGVNEEIPREPAEGRAGAGRARRGGTAAAPDGETHGRGARGSGPGGNGAGRGRPRGGGTRQAELAEGELAQAELAQAELRRNSPRGSRDAKLAGTAELAGPGEPGLDAAEEHRDVSPLAVAGIILGILALVGAAVGVLAVITHGFRPKTVITYRPAAVFGLRPGECINSAGNGLNVTVLSCATPHDAEVFATFSLPEGPWPGASAVQQDAGNGCVSRLGGYLNPQLATAALSQEYVYPNQAAWQAGERTVVCEVRSVSGQLTGSVRAPN